MTFQIVNPAAEKPKQPTHGAGHASPPHIRSHVAGGRSPLLLGLCLSYVVSVCAGLLACTNDERVLPPPVAALPSAGSSLRDTPELALACSEGAVENCAVTLGEHGGVLSCYEGERTCKGGTFGACENGHSFDLPRDAVNSQAQSVSLRPLSFSSPSACLNNPCNRYCREFNEAPMTGISADVDDSAPPLSTWPTGSLADYPPELIAVGTQEPCQIAGDCQFNTSCNDPALGSCSHSVCAAGDALAPGCNRCSDLVCALDADCCGSTPACAHDPCEVGSGAPLDRTCDTCTDAVCAAHPECCDVSWNDACVGYVASECAPLGQSCGCPAGSVAEGGTCYLLGGAAQDWFLARDACSNFGIGWSLIQVDDATENALAQSLMTSAGLGGAWLGGLEAGIDQWLWQRSGETFFISAADGGSLQPGYTYANWASTAPDLGLDGRAIVMTTDGTWRDAPVSLELDSLCEGTPNRLGPRRSPFSWGQNCVDLAQSECGMRCPEGVPLGLGSCTARVATQLDVSCATFDLALGATCEEAGLPQVPVCNHGQLAAPTGLQLRHLPISELGKAAPDMSAAGTCTLNEPIPPGRCVVVSDCPGLTSGRALVINPVDGTQNTSECRFDDNWSIYQPVSCRPPVCEADTHDATQVAANDCAIAIANPLNIDVAQASISITAGLPEPHCADGEVRWGSSCYAFVSNQAQTWDAARASCRERGADWDLVSLNSPAENTWVRAQTNASDDVWIGLNDKSTEGDHVWSNGSCRSFTNWDTSTAQPDNNPPGSEQCTRMTAAAGERWEDKACNDDQDPYVCEGPVLDARGGCASGQLAGPDGACYAFDATPQSWLAAQTACQGLGTGWGLVTIDGAGTNDFVTGLLACTPAWLANPPGSLGNWAPAESVDLSDAPYIDALGLWHTALDSTPRARLCQGPANTAATAPLSQVASSAACTSDAQYYFEGSAVAPETLKLCPATCALASSVAGSRVEIEIPCAPPPPPALETTKQMYYEADCGGGSTLWDFFYYDSVTPADSRIEFEMRTGPSLADLAAGGIPFIPIAQAHAVPDNTQKCEVSQLDCPVDIFSKLGSPAQEQPVLELNVRLIPGSSGEGPLLRDWKVRFSCPPSQ
jgi:lectin-like protein